MFHVMLNGHQKEERKTISKVVVVLLLNSNKVFSFKLSESKYKHMSSYI